MASGKTLQAVIDMAGNIDPSLSRSINGAVGQLDKVENKSKKMQTAVKIAAVAAGAALIKFGKDSIESAISFESSMADVAKVVDGLKDSTGKTTEAYAEMSAGIVDMSTKIPMAADEITEIVAAAGQSGIAKDELLGFAESAAKMGIAFDSTAEQSGAWMAQWRTAMDLTQDEVVGLADQINHLGNTSSEDAQKLSQIVSDLGSLGQMAGVTGGELAAMGAATTGIDAAVASTGLKNMIVAMVKGESVTKRQSDVLDKLGMSATDLADRMQTDAQGAIMDMLGAINELPKAEQAAAIQNFFGKESLNTVSTLANNLGNLEEQFIKVGDAGLYGGSMEEEYEARASTVEYAMQKIQNKWEAIKITAGTSLLPAVADNLERIDPLLNLAGTLLTGLFGAIGAGIIHISSFVGWLDKMPGGLQAAGVLLAGITALLMAYKIQQAMATATTGIWAVAAGTGTIATTALGAAFSFLTAPIGIVIMAIMAVIAIGVLLYKNWDVVVAKMKSAGAALKSFFTSIGAAIGNVFKAPINFWIKNINMFIKGLNKLKIPDWVPGVGGKGINIPLIPMLAAGGFTEGISIAGEAGQEAVISFDPAYRSQNLGYWAEAGARLGVSTGGELNDLAMGSGDVVYDIGGITFAPQVVVNDGTSPDDIIEIIKAKEEELVEYFLDLIDRQEVGVYGYFRGDPSILS